MITVQPTNRTTYWVSAQVADSVIAGPVSSKKQMASRRVPNDLDAQAGIGLGVFIARHIRNARALLSNLLHGSGTAAVHGGNVPAVLF